MVNNVINLSDRRPKPADPWQHAQPTVRSIGDREELWSHPYFGISQLIWATGSNDIPEPPGPSGGTPVANGAAGYTRLRVAA